MQDLLKDGGKEQEEFEAANPLPQSFLSRPRALLATFITTGCDIVSDTQQSLLRCHPGGCCAVIRGHQCTLFRRLLCFRL
jgi:hypothetical protein